MSFFYLTSVKGDIPKHLLEIIIDKRLEYLKAVVNGETVNYNEYVVDGSLYDNVGHFVLCIASILCENTEFSEFFLKAEVELFKTRLASMSTYDMRCFAKKLLRYIRKYDSVPSFIHPLQVLCQYLLIKDLAQHVCSAHTNACHKHHVQISFTHCLSFIARRQVELYKGQALIPCGLWKQYLTLLFKSNLKYRLDQCNLTSLKNDPRLMEMLDKLKTNFHIFQNSYNNVLLSKDVDKASAQFPPCMLNLHLNLRKKHRLSHTQRFYYSLFLKDIGVPIEESIDFWSAEYRQSPNGSHSCCHSWEKDEKKYVYGIRHMYGLEGRKKSYSSMNCHRIQATDKACHEGGCPFKSFDHSKMVQLLNIPNEILMSQIYELKKSGHYTSACMLYLKSKYETIDCYNVGFDFTPVKYYMIATKNNVMS